MSTALSVSDLVDRSIKGIRQAGYRVYVKHSRYYEVMDDGGNPHVVGPFTKKEAEGFGFTYRNLLSRGGHTDVELYNGDELVCAGGACCSHKDAFVRKVGRQIALGRALSGISR